MDFDTAKSYLDRLAKDDGTGVKALQCSEYRGEAGVDRKSVYLPLFRSINPGFSSTQWMSLACREGNSYVGGCCGNMSAVQDIICSWFRHDAFSIPISELAEVAEAMIRHDGEDSGFAVLPWEWQDPVAESWTGWDDVLGTVAPIWETLGPWYALSILWHLVKDNWTPEVIEAPSPNRNPLRDALFMLSNSAAVLDCHYWFGGDDNPGSQERASHARSLAKFIPAFQTIHGHLTELDWGGFEGWALIDLRDEGGTSICRNGYGYCFYETLVEVQEIAKQWRRSDEEHEDDCGKKPPIDERIGMRPVRVGWELKEGYEFTGPLEPLPGAKKP